MSEACVISGEWGERFSHPNQIEVYEGARMIDQAALAHTSAHAAAPEEKQSLKGLSVLLVEDSIDNQLLISLFLEKSGARTPQWANLKFTRTKGTATVDNFDRPI